MRKGGCRKALPVCRCLALARLALIRFAFSRFAAFARQLAVSPQGDQPSRCGGASTQWGRIGRPLRSAMGERQRQMAANFAKLPELLLKPPETLTGCSASGGLT